MFMWQQQQPLKSGNTFSRGLGTLEAGVVVSHEAEEGKLPGLLEAEERKIIIIVAMAMASCRIPELALAIIYLL
ncbi:unnamed protein product [Sphagnum balticum]